MPSTPITSTATLWVIAAVQFLTPFMFSAIGVALPSIGEEFSVGAFQLGLIEMICVLAVALLLLPIGRYADIHGRKRIFLAGILVITTATLGLAMAPSIGLLIFFRFFQGIGAAMITSSSLAIIGKTDYGMASRMIATMRTIGMLTAMTLITVLLAWFLGKQSISPDTRHLFLTAMHAAMAIFSVLGAVGIVCSMGRTGKIHTQSLIPEGDEAC